MNDLQLPHELAAFEVELQALPRAAMPTSLRERVLADIQAALTAPAMAPATFATPNNLSTRWWFAACAAMVAMLWLNLSLVAARSAGEGWQLAAPLPQPATIAETQATLATLLPELSPQDSQHYALTLFSGTPACLLPVPAGAK